MGEAGNKRESRTVDRLINFSDAVVAVAVTLLALPLVDIAAPSPGQSVWEVLSDHSGQLYSFLFTFYVVIAMWAVHNRILNVLNRIDGLILWLNATWLALIVLLPWFSSMFGESEMFASDDMRSLGVGMLYWSTLAAISLLGTAMSVRLHARPDLTVLGEDEDDGYSDPHVMWRGPVLGAYFLFLGISTIVVPGIAPWLPFGIIPLSIWMRPRRGTADAH